MTLFDWIIPLSGTIATKAVETITSELLKSKLAEAKSDRAKNSLLNLYEQLAQVETESKDFVVLLSNPS